MTIEVTGPDGAIHEFPDDTSPDVIKRVMAKQYGGPAAAAPSGPAPAISPATDFANQASIDLSRGAINTIGAIPDAASYLKSAVNRYIFDLVLGKIPEGAIRPSPNVADLSNVLGSAALNQTAAKAVPGLASAPQGTAGQYGRTIGGRVMIKSPPLLASSLFGLVCRFDP
jgi:hypothetical protein